MSAKVVEVGDGQLAAAISDGMMKALTDLQRDIMAAAAEAMQEGIDQGVDLGHERIESAFTKTGIKRMEREGGHPGRIVTGDFRDDFTGDVSRVNETELLGRIGWIGEDGTPIYYDVQENGSEAVGVEAVHALFDGHQVAYAEFKARLKKAGLQ